MTFIADLHIHSKYSRATAKNLDLENLYLAAQIKGISLVGTGDFTHPAWIEELETKLVETEPGLFSLRPEVAGQLDPLVPKACKGEVRFILQAEISNIYKKADRVRKNHNLIYFPSLESAKAFNARLDAIGNIKSDGRPILGLDARDLLEIMLETSDRGFLVPAHIWTPWFSMFGSKSGFDTIEDCFEDLSQHIFACETGLSSDPPMNWRVKNLDRVRLISNSDAHSPGFLGRNASVFDTPMDFYAIRSALETHDLDAYKGTLDMYPDQGKYHYDGHRKCNVRLNPDETANLNGICPVCGKPMTLGVLYRVRELANRPEGYAPENRHPFSYVVPLADVMSEIFGVGPKTKKVTGYYDKAVSVLGPELHILTRASLEEIESAGVPLLKQAIDKMRRGDLYIEPGYDGEFGKVRLFSHQEREAALGQAGLGLKVASGTVKKKPKPLEQTTPPKVRPLSETARLPEKQTLLAAPKSAPPKSVPPKPAPKNLLDGLNPEQDRAVRSSATAILIQAGPGTGKTRTLAARIAWLLREQSALPGQILALTFTNKAARELEERIETFQPSGQGRVLAATFHSFSLKLLREYKGFSRALMDDTQRLEVVKEAMIKVMVKVMAQENGRSAGKGPGTRKVRQADRMISLAKQRFLGPSDDLGGIAEEDFPDLAAVYSAYDALCEARELADFEDLIFMAYQALGSDEDLLQQVHSRFTHIFVDEYQDLNQGQYDLVQILAKQAHLFVIGDPDQSIYGFRGSDNRFFHRFETDYPGCEQIRLRQNYRSTQTILDASFQMISGPEEEVAEARRIYAGVNTSQKLVIRKTASASAEAVAVGKMIESLVGGLSMLSSAARAGGEEGLDGEYSFSDFAVLYRTRAQCEIFAAAFEKAGIPFQTADRERWQTAPGMQDVLELLKASRNEPNLPSSQLLASIGEQLEMAVRVQENPETLSAWQHLTYVAQRVPDSGAFLDHLALNRDADLLVPGAEKVSLMTMHAAKGLEFPVVFVTGCETGIIPFARDLKQVENEAEERRLFYVAMTRAMDILCLTYATKRRIYGLEKKQQRSYFIDDIERELARFDTAVKKPIHKKTEVQLELF